MHYPLGCFDSDGGVCFTPATRKMLDVVFCVNKMLWCATHSKKVNWHTLLVVHGCLDRYVPPGRAGPAVLCIFGMGGGKLTVDELGFETRDDSEAFVLDDTHWSISFKPYVAGTVLLVAYPPTLAPICSEPVIV